ncbi:MAG: hypothetical protein A2074_04095 [Candidatus Aquicultor primus]|uniref:NAD-dependent epimerase/dehydratase domain-containing protein n=1 Tax=Candidatus Aquicultor primus TaxID=1797195 RepID=A0A1F2URT0_9ACTN|nr:MAG: hypothetical protein A2074_04095 [Candidatus Aquicultor primus]
MNHIVKEDVEAIIRSGGDLWEAFAGKSILVTGANGLVPYYFAATVLELNRGLLKGRECSVMALVRSRERGETRFKEHLGGRHFELIVQDVNVPPEIPGPVDYIIHAASQASPKYYGSDPAGTMLPNVLGTLNLLRLAASKKSRGFLFVSGGEVYGIVPEDKIPTKETDYGWLDPVNVRSCYAEGKRAGETLCSVWNKQYGVPAVIARLAHTYGPGLRLDDGRVFADFVRDVLAGKDIELRSDGKAERSFCYVADAVLGMFIAMLKGTPASAYNVCNDEACISVRGLAQIMAGLFPEKHISVKFAGESDLPGYLKSPIQRSCMDSSRLRALGWRPMTGIEDGFRRTIRSFSL